MWRDTDPLTKIEFQKMVAESDIEFGIKNKIFRTSGLTPFYRFKAIKNATSVVI